MKKLFVLLPLLITMTTTVSASEHICNDQTPNNQQERIVQSYSSDSVGIKEMKKNYSSVGDYMKVKLADINNDGIKEIFYSLRGGSCGEPVGVLLDLGNGRWKEILKEDCYSGCWILLDSSKDKFRDILQKNMSNNKGRSKCVYNAKKEKYTCSK